MDNRLNELSDKVDALSKYEQDFVLWLLLRNYINDCATEIEKNTKITELGGEVIERELVTRMITLDRHLKTAKEMRDVLAYSLW